MHPLSTALILLGYALAVPLAGRLPIIVANQQRLALAGHQGGMMAAMVGWLARGSYTVAAGHALWMIGLRIWFDLARRRAARPPIRHGGSNG